MVFISNIANQRNNQWQLFPSAAFAELMAFVQLRYQSSGRHDAYTGWAGWSSKQAAWHLEVQEVRKMSA